MPPRKPPREPTEHVLHEAALAHLARFGTTRAGLLRVLDRKVARWATLTGGDPAPGRAAARAVVDRLVASGAVNDQVFAEARARSLVRSGRSVRAVGAHLAAKGVNSALAAEALPEGVEAQACNCSICEKVGFIHIITPQSAFRLLSGRDALSSYRFNTGVAEHLFCSVCGVKSFYRPRSNPDGWSVNARCLDDLDDLAISITPFDGRQWERHGADLAHLSKEVS